MAIDEKTDTLDLPLPNPANPMDHDCLRIAQALRLIDDWAASGGSVAMYANKAAFPSVGDATVLYLAKDTGRLYRWETSAYLSVARLSSTDDLTEGTNNLYFTNARARAALQPATASVLGGIKVGSGLSVGLDGMLSTVGGGGGASLPAFNELVMHAATNGQTVFTPSGGYTAGTIELFLNGVLLVGNGDDYTASNGTTITLTQGVNTTDTLLLRRWTTSTNLPYSALTDKPSTVDGFGITDAVKKTGDSMTGALNWAAAVTVASAATANIGGAASNLVTITGTTAITSFGNVAAGVWRKVTFAGVLTLTHNSTSMILPGAANITTAAGDVAEFVSLGGGNWRCASYLRADGRAISTAGLMPLSGGNFSGDVVTAQSAEQVTGPNAGRFAVSGVAGSGAKMSFIRSGEYGINFGLDADNVVRMGGWSDGSNSRFAIDQSGNFTARGDVAGTSDERLKTDWSSIAADFVHRLASVKHGTYTRTDTGARQVGVSAQSLRDVLPEAVHEDDKGMLSVAYGNAALAACVQLAQRVVELEARIKAMEGA